MADRNDYQPEEITNALLALIACHGQYSPAIRYLRKEGHRAPTKQTFSAWARVTHFAQYQELREKHGPQIEKALVHDYRDLATLAVDAERLAVEQARDKLARGEDPDPSKTAANLSRVAQSSTEKMLTLDGRPSKISETRDVEAIFRSLVQMGVLSAPDDPPALMPGEES